ncbi:BlaI/MecI/CopY family transcriptional regulator [Yinghuangia sp. YIM S09857]|uniref:BlaI/MecI/CopY family transcriptional regulator n=1 Tax=Yinghuangia sp. YIM S09857 TaxID=3436929 RepID=UPI003F532FCF
MSPRDPAPPLFGLGPLEQDVMAVLWSADGPLPVRDVLDALNDRRDAPLAYTTVMTVLVRLADKGAATRGRVGRGYAYAASVPDQAALAVRAVLRDFGDAAIAHFVDHAARDPEILARLERLVGARTADPPRPPRGADRAQ